MEIVHCSRCDEKTGPDVMLWRPCESSGPSFQSLVWMGQMTQGKGMSNKREKVPLVAVCAFW